MLSAAQYITYNNDQINAIFLLTRKNFISEIPKFLPEGNPPTRLRATDLHDKD